METSSILDEISIILERIPSSNLDSDVIIEVSEDKSEAYLTITHPALSGKIPQFEDILEQIKQRGIVNIDEGLIRRILKERDFGKKHIIARGEKPKKGENARYLYRFGKIEGKESPLDKFEAIPGQLLAVKEAPKKGEDGIDVFGNIIPGIMGDDITIIAGKNTAISRDRTRVYAVRNGFVSWKENRVDLEPLIKIDGDLTENLEFDGMLEVSGSIKNAKIKIGGNINVSYNISDSSITAGGSIEVFGEIVKSKITSKGDIIGNAVSESNLTSSSSIIIKTGIRDCEIRARSVFITGGKGIIMTKGTPPPALFTIPIVIAKGLSGLSGGKVWAERVIDVEALGDVSHKKTEVFVEKGGSVSISSSVYPKTRITIGQRTQEILKPIEGVTFIEEKGKLLTIPYKQAEVELMVPIYGPTILKDPPSIIMEGEKTKKGASILLQIEEEKLSEFPIPEYQAIIFFQKDIDGPWNRLILEIEKKRKEEREKPGSFKIDSLPEGLYLTITPPGPDGMPVKPKDLVENLKEYKGLNLEAIRDAIIKMDGKPVKIGERQYIPEIDGRIILSLEKEGEIENAKVFLTIGSPKEGGRQIPFTEIIKFIEKEGIRLPYDKRKIAIALKKKYYNKPFLITEAIPPKKGKDAHYLYKLYEDYPEAIPGQILAIKEGPTIGESGKDCKGNIIPGILGEDFKIKGGKNTFLSKDGNILYSSSFGKVFWTNNRCDVERVLEYVGDLDKNIEFPGRVIIQGSLKRGVKIKAGGGVLIKGGVSTSCEITSGGSIEIDGDVKGEDGKEVSLSAKADIIANSISFSNISCEGSLIAKTGVVDSNVSASSLVITGRKGIIMTKGTPPPAIFNIPIAMAPGVKGLVGGGKTEVLKFIDVEQIGSVLHKKTEVIVRNEKGIISVSDAIYPKVKMVISKAFLLVGKPYEGGASFKQEGGKIVKHTYEPIPAELTFIPYSTDVRDIPPSIVLLKGELENATKFLNLSGDKISSIELTPKFSLFFPKEIEGPWREKEKEIALKIKEKEEMPGSFKIDNTQDGVFLTINPPGIRGKPVVFEDVLKASEQFIDIDENAIKEAIIKKDGRPVKIGERQYIEGLDSPVKIEIIDEGGIKAKRVILTIGEEKPGGRKVRFKEVMWLLKKKGVAYGIDERKILLALKRDYHKPFVVADCLLPTKGERGDYLYRYEYKFEAIEGQILAVKKRPTPGNPGINCLGEEIPPIFGDDFEIIEGRNTRLSEDGDILYSQAFGMVIWDGNKASVEKTIYIEKDLNESLSFPGKIIIKGSIKKGLVVSALGNIEVGGDIEEGCSVSSNETVMVYGQILSSSIFAKYDIIASGAFDANLKANGAIIMETGMRCKASCDRIYVVGKKGIIMSKEKPEKGEFVLPVAMERGVKGLIGGEIKAREVYSDIIGSVSQEETVINLLEKGRIGSFCIYPNTKITIGLNTLEIKKECDSILFYEEGGKIKEGVYNKTCEPILTEPKIEKREERYPESIALPEKEIERACEFLKISSDSLSFFELGDKIGLFFEKGIEGPWVSVIKKQEEERRKERERDASFEIKNLPEGLYITVNPPGVNGKPLSEEEIEKSLAGFYNLDKEAIKNAIKESKGKPVKIGERQYIRDIDSKIEVIVD